MAETSAKPPRRWTRWLLFGSLALNLLVVGLIAGAALRMSGWGIGPPVRGLGPALYRELPREDRRALRQTLRTAGGDAMSPGDQARLLSAALRAEPFDPDALEALINQQAEALQLYQFEVQRKWLAQVAEMSPAERNAYADRLEESLQRRHNHKKKGGTRTEDR